MSRVLCVRGTADPPRDRWGHCICDPCRAYKYDRVRGIPRLYRSRTEYHRQWRARNPDKVRAYTAKWLAANPDKRAEAVRSWRERHPEIVQEMNSKAGRKWAKNNKGIRNASVKARQMAKRRAMPSWVDRDAIQAFYLEAARLSAESGIPHEVDHIVPLQGELACGLHVAVNLQVLPRAVNRAKHNRTGDVVWPAS